MNDEDKEHLNSVLRHIERVRASCELLAGRIMAASEDEDEFALSLVRNSMNHDISKLSGIEWKYLRVALAGTKEFGEALEHHQSTNEHHPEHWGDINEMPRIFVAEMVTDWHARSQEMGTDLRFFIKNTASKKYDMSLNGKTYKTVKHFVDLLLDPVFKPIKKIEKKTEKKEESAST